MVLIESRVHPASRWCSRDSNHFKSRQIIVLISWTRRSRRHGFHWPRGPVSQGPETSNWEIWRGCSSGGSLSVRPYRSWKEWAFQFVIRPIVLKYLQRSWSSIFLLEMRKQDTLGNFMRFWKPKKWWARIERIAGRMGSLTFISQRKKSGRTASKNTIQDTGLLEEKILMVGKCRIYTFKPGGKVNTDTERSFPIYYLLLDTKKLELLSWILSPSDYRMLTIHFR